MLLPGAASCLAAWRVCNICGALLLANTVQSHACLRSTSRTTSVQLLDCGYLASGNPGRLCSRCTMCLHHPHVHHTYTPQHTRRAHLYMARCSVTLVAGQCARLAHGGVAECCPAAAARLNAPVQPAVSASRAITGVYLLRAACLSAFGELAVC